MRKKLLISLAIFLCFFILLALIYPNKNDDTKENANNLLKKDHTITLVVDNSTKQKVAVDDGKVLIIDFTPTKDKHLFMGWYTDSACTIPYDFSRPVTTDFTLYAAFTLKTKTINFKNANLKALSSTYDNDASYSLSLYGFDLEYLEKNGMGLKIQIRYRVKYSKDYDMPFDIGYAGSPKYELSLINSSLQGYFEENLTTTSSAIEKSYTYVAPIYFCEDGQLSLIFSTDNVQNIISFTDIVITIEAVKVR